MILDDILKQLSAFLSNYNDDAIDRLHYLYSTISLSIYLIFITSKQYYGDPIQCVFNKDTPSETIKYIHSMCWLNGTFYVEEKNGSMIDFVSMRRLNYYQWIVFILIFKVFLFRLPSCIWSFFISLNGFDLTHVTNIIMNKIYQDEYLESANWKKTKGAIEAIGEHLRLSFLKQKFQPHKRFQGFLPTDRKIGWFGLTPHDEKKAMMSSEDKARLRQNFPNLKTKSSFPLFAPYLIVKLIYVANIVFNFWFLTAVFGFQYYTYGFDFIRLLVAGEYKFINQYFPKRSACFPKIMSKYVDNQNMYICSLPINLTNEYFYAAYWYWLLVLAVLTLISISYWSLLIIRPFRRRLVLHALQLGPKQNIQISYTAALYFGDEANLETADAFLREKTGMSLMDNFNLFFNDVCSIDVVFIIKLISLNSSSLAFRDILNHLWEVYLDLDDLKIKDVDRRPIMPIRRPPQPLVLGPVEGGHREFPRQRSTQTAESGSNDEKSKFLSTEPI